MWSRSVGLGFVFLPCSRAASNGRGLIVPRLGNNVDKKKNNEGNERLGRLWINAGIYYRRTVGRERTRRGVGVSPRGRARILFNYALQMDRGHARHPLMTRRIVNYCQ